MIVGRDLHAYCGTYVRSLFKCAGAEDTSLRMPPLEKEALTVGSFEADHECILQFECHHF